MKKRMLSAVLAGALLLPSASAANTQPAVPSFGPNMPISTVVSTVVNAITGFTNAAVEASAGSLSVSSGGVLAVTDLEKLVKRDNLTLQMLNENLNALEAALKKGDKRELKSSLRALESQAAQMNAAVSAIQNALPQNAPMSMEYMMAKYGADQLNQTVSALEGMLAQLEALEDGRDALETTIADTEKQLTFGAQSLYIVIVGLQSQYDDLLRTRITLSTTVTEMEKRYELGQISALQLEQTKNGLVKLESGLQTLIMSIENLKGDLNLMLGRKADASFSLAPLPAVTDAQLAAVSYDANIKTVLKNSIDVRDADDARDTAGDRYEGIRKAKEAAEAAADLSYESTVNSVSQSFRKLCRDVTDKRQLVTAAQSDYALALKQFEVDTVNYKNGTLSENKYQAAQATLETAANAVTNARNNLYTAYLKYQWALKGIVSTS